MQRVGVLALCEVSDSVDVIETGIEFVEKRQELSSRTKCIEMHIQINVPSSCLRWQVSFVPFAS